MAQLMSLCLIVMVLLASGAFMAVKSPARSGKETPLRSGS